MHNIQSSLSESKLLFKKRGKRKKKPRLEDLNQIKTVPKFSLQQDKPKARVKAQESNPD